MVDVNAPASLAHLQSERDALRAADARMRYEAAFADTCAAADVLADGQNLRNAMLIMLDGLAARLVDACAHEHEETRVHHALSDRIHTELSALGEHLNRAAPRLPWMGASAVRGGKPRDLLTVSQWADRHRWIETGTNAPGQWHTSLTPYLGEIMDSLSEHSAVRSVTFMKSSGVGGTEVLYNWIGYIMHHLQNKDMLLVVPTLELRDRSLNPRLSKMLEEAPALRELTATGQRNRTNRADIMEYGARARLIKSGANSPDSMRSDHVPYVACDEVSAYPWDVGGEGDPMTLLDNRQRTFSRAKTYYVSTPTTEGQCRIAQLYSRSDQRHYHVACPHCDETQPLVFANLKYRARATAETGAEKIAEAVWYECAHCHASIDEGHKTDMLAGGKWIPARPHITDQRGYHLNALYAPIGLGLGWKKIIQRWLNAQGDSAELKSFINTYLGEVWSEQGDEIETAPLLARLEVYPETLPIVARTVFADVQKDRIEFSVVDWASSEECWLFDHVIIPGETASADVWEDLHLAIADYTPDGIGIDSGYNTSRVYAFVEKRRWAFATKGVPGMGRPIIEDEARRRQRLRRKRKHAAPIEPLGIDGAKLLLYARLKLTEPGVPGYVHFRQSPAFDDEYFAQLGAEKLVTKIRGTRPFQEWVQTRPRNEALDCLVGNLAVWRLIRERMLANPRKTATVPIPTPKPAAPKPAKTLARDEWSKRL